MRRARPVLLALVLVGTPSPPLHASMVDLGFSALQAPERRREEFRRVRDEIADRLCRLLIEEYRLAPSALHGHRC